MKKALGAKKSNQDGRSTQARMTVVINKQPTRFLSLTRFNSLLSCASDMTRKPRSVDHTNFAVACFKIDTQIMIQITPFCYPIFKKFALL